MLPLALRKLCYNEIDQIWQANLVPVEIQELVQFGLQYLGNFDYTQEIKEGISGLHICSFRDAKGVMVSASNL